MAKRKTGNLITASLLVISGVLIVWASQWCQTRHYFNVNDVAVADSGEVFAIVTSDQSYRSAIWKWSADLSRHETLFRNNHRASALVCSHDGKFLLVLFENELVKYDCELGERVWRATVDSYFAQAIDAHLSDGNRYLVVVDGWRRANRISFFNAQNGKPLGERTMTSEVWQVDTYDDLVRISTKRMPVVLDFSAENIRTRHLETQSNEFDWQRHEVRPVWRDVHSVETVSASTETIDVQGERTKGTSPPAIRVSNRKTGQTHSVSLSTTRTWVSYVWGMIAVGGAIWTLILLYAFDWPKHLDVVCGLACLFGLLCLCCTNLPALVKTDFFENSIPTAGLAILAGLLVCGMFATALATSRPVYQWLVFYLGCAVPFVLPVILGGFIMRWMGMSVQFHRTVISRVTKSSWVPRFEIQHMLLLTAAIAVFVGVGIHFVLVSLETSFWSVLMILGTVLTSLAFSQRRAVAGLIAVICVFVILAVQGSQAMQSGVKIVCVFVSTIGLTIAFTRVVGYRIRRSSKVSFEGDVQSQ